MKPDTDAKTVRIALVVPAADKRSMMESAEKRGLTLSEEWRRLKNLALKDDARHALETIYGRQAGALLRCYGEMMRPTVSRIGLSLQGDWAGGNPSVFASVSHEIRRFNEALQLDVPLDDAVRMLLEGAPLFSSAAALIDEIFNTDPREYSSQWRATLREDLGPELSARGIAVRAEMMAWLSNEREAGAEEPRQPDRGIQRGWADATILAKDDMPDQQVAGIRAQIARINRQARDGQLSPRALAGKIRFIKAEIGRIADLDPVMREELFGLLGAVGRNAR